MYIEQQGRQKCFRQIEAFADFDDNKISHMVKNSKTESYAMNTPIKEETDRTDQSIFVIKGTIEIYR